MPKAIMHLDGDAFFTSVESAKNPYLRGKAIVTGHERGIASAMSYEAKKLGITRAMPIFEIRKKYPKVIVVNSDYDSYAIYSKRMFDIVRRYVPVEVYSIDECFADLSEFCLPPRQSNCRGGKENYEELRPICEKIKKDIRIELGIGVSLGVGPTKTLAKTASKWKKPNGLTFIPPILIKKFLEATPVEKIWGIGKASANELKNKGITNTYDFTEKKEIWVRENFSKPLTGIWYELKGISISPVSSEQRNVEKSISKTGSFPSTGADEAYIFSELSRNIENACERARERKLFAKEAHFFIKTKDYIFIKSSHNFDIATNTPFEIVCEAKKFLKKMFVRGILYRATGVTLTHLSPDSYTQANIFGGEDKQKELSKLFTVTDKLNRKYGKGSIYVASSAKTISKERNRDKKNLKNHEHNLPRPLSVPILGFVE